MTETTLGQVSNEIKETCKGEKAGLPVVGLEHLIPEEVTLTQWDENVENTFTKQFSKGDMLFGRRRAYLKKAALAPFDGICSGDITVIRAKPECISPDLLPFIIQSDDLFDYAVGKSAGSLSPRVKWEHLKGFKLRLPEISEQEKLAEILWGIEETRNAYKKLIAATDELVKSQFIEMFEKRGYPVSTIEETCTLKSGTTFSSELELPVGDIIYAKVSDMNLPENSKYIRTSKTFVSRETAGKTLIPAGSVVFPKRGAAIATNKKRIAENSICIDLNTMAVTPKELDLQYLYQYFQNIDMGTLYNGSSVPQVNNKDIAPLIITVPPREKQIEFSEFVEQSDKSKFAANQALTELNATKKALMRQYLG